MLERIKILLNYYKLSASSFADRIDVPRSSISHLLSGRNKPSLDFVMKVVEAFNEVNLEWLVYGSGEFPNDKKSSISVNTSLEIEKEKIEKPQVSNTPDINLFSEIPTNVPKEKKIENIQISEPSKIDTNSKKIIKKVILFYSDDSFEAFDNN